MICYKHQVSPSFLFQIFLIFLVSFVKRHPSPYLKCFYHRIENKQNSTRTPAHPRFKAHPRSSWLHGDFHFFWPQVCRYRYLGVGKVRFQNRKINDASIFEKGYPLVN